MIFIFSRKESFQPYLLEAFRVNCPQLNKRFLRLYI